MFSVMTYFYDLRRFWSFQYCCWSAKYQPLFFVKQLKWHFQRKSKYEVSILHSECQNCLNLFVHYAKILLLSAKNGCSFVDRQMRKSYVEAILTFLEQLFAIAKAYNLIILIEFFFLESPSGSVCVMKKFS